jgi:hypothetical protein
MLKYYWVEAIILLPVERISVLTFRPWKYQRANRVICNVAPSLHPAFGPPFTPYPLFQWYLQSKDIFIKFQYEMLKLSILYTRFETNYRGCIVRSSENICSSSGGVQEKGKTG